MSFGRETLQFLRRIVGEEVFSLTTSVVRLDGFRDDGAGGVAALVVLTLGGDGPSHIAGRESQGDRCARHNGRRESDDDFVDLLLGHILSFWGLHSVRLQ